jgi:UDP-2,3-diacylglucosamine pyrophosphatase LpxH
MAHKKGCYGVICGHIHQPADIMIDGKRYLNSGDWIENMSAILVDYDGKLYLYQR